VVLKEFFFYIIYSSDQSTLNNTLVTDYADDKVILISHKDPIIPTKNVQTNLNELSFWYTIWSCKVNKIKYIHATFSLRYGICTNGNFNEIQILTITKTNYLGIAFDKRLTWTKED